MPIQLNISQLFNPLKKKLLNSPLGMFLQDDIGLMEYTDRNSGKTLNHAVVLHPEKGFYWLAKEKADSFWRNFQGGAMVKIRYQGSEIKGWAEIMEEPETTKTILAHIVNDARLSFFMNVGMDSSDTFGEAQIDKHTKLYQVLIIRRKEVK
jgi:hypothetical protein